MSDAHNDLRKCPVCRKINGHLNGCEIGILQKALAAERKAREKAEAELNMWKMKCAEADGNTERVSEERDRLREALKSLCRAWFIEDGDGFNPAYQQAKRLLKSGAALYPKQGGES